jgi:BirA family transcriptional regulator, biotin operon repressor / biotin---[acetyl-CoA-carboxylase] ligase
LYKIPASTLFMGSNLVFMPECHSTNTLALQLCQQSSTPEGTLVITNNQTAGRGQRGNAWEAEPGKNLTLSLILKPVFLNLKDQFFLNMIISLAVYDYFITKKITDIHIKWPNDVMAGNKKLCGILIENQIQGSQFVHSVAGMGININQQHFSVSTATSLHLITGIQYTLQDELELLLQKIEARYLQLRQNALDKIKNDYLNVLYWKGKNHLFSSNGQHFSGTIVGIDDMGRLKVQREDHDAVQVFDLKEISYVQ